MTAHDTSNQFVIRLPEVLWQQLLRTGHMADILSPTSLKVFSEAVRGCSGGGHARFVIGKAQVLGRILLQLRVLAAPGMKDVRRELAGGKADFDRLGHQRIKPRDEVRIKEQCTHRHDPPAQ